MFSIRYGLGWQHDFDRRRKRARGSLTKKAALFIDVFCPQENEEAFVRVAPCSSSRRKRFQSQLSRRGGVKKSERDGWREGDTRRNPLLCKRGVGGGRSRSVNKGWDFDAPASNSCHVCGNGSSRPTTETGSSFFRVPRVEKKEFLLGLRRSVTT